MCHIIFKPSVFFRNPYDLEVFEIVLFKNFRSSYLWNKIVYFAYFFTNIFSYCFPLLTKRVKTKLFCLLLSGEIFLSPSRPHKSMCVRIYIFCFKKKHTQTKKIPLANLFVRVYVFFHSKNKRQDSLFFNKEKCCQSSFLSVNFV